ncbi:hyaluronate lyase [Pasteurella langaaensis DSM 22999]|uniref:Hyaluronate lyase n=1 Tax=Alitibacter langaaensis DSM 22999 TaxID=1122935 RepID=A0A2U0T6I9_9PAST|nr:polysaccharide lyase 8 family protein [Pasteurella langaaensis]PVX39209.1 hyaluronate lyase [Pasteurella langaaensis DSM 22999]
MKFTRRKFILGTTSLSLTALFCSSFGFAATTKLTSSQYSDLCERWGDIITGRKNIDPKDPRYAKALAGLDKRVKNVLDDLILDENRTSILKSANLSEEKSPFITKTARAALTLATGWATPGSSYYQNNEILQQSIQALSDFLRLRYNPSQEEYGNWWDWESGASRAVADMMCLLHKELPADVMNAAALGIDHFVPDPWYLRTQKASGSSHKENDKIISTGANRLDLSRAVICRALALPDKAKIQHALLGLSATLTIVEQGDGFYKDGSFIQHTSIPYTGSYGDVLIGGLAMLFSLVSGNEFNIPQQQLNAVYWAVDEAFIPTIINGQVLDNVRGRSVSRYTEPGSLHGASIMKAILQLAEKAPPEISNRWYNLTKSWIEQNNYNRITDNNSLTYLALVIQALNHASGSPIKQTSKMFSSMDRLVHRTNNWSASIAMCSNRIAWYECGNQENEWASRTSLGMRYLYLPNDMGQYEDAFWPTLNYNAPTGTTVDTTPLVPKVAGEWGHSTPQNEWTGGLTQGNFSLAAMHLLSPDGDLHARRFWFGTPDAIIEFVADIHSSQDALTVIEHRNLGENNSSAHWVIDGKTFKEKTALENTKWAYLDGVGGYLFLTPQQIEAQIEQRQGSWLHINPARKGKEAEKEHKRLWATLHTSHKNQNNAAWVIIPNADLKEMDNIATKFGAETKLLQNDANAQVLKQGNITAWAVWKAGKYADWSFEQPTIALAKAENQNVYLTLAEPTQKRQNIKLSLPGEWKLAASNNKAKLNIVNGSTHLSINTQNLAGQSIDLQLIRR